MARRYSFGWMVWFLVVVTLGPGCGDGESSKSRPKWSSDDCLCGSGTVGCGKACDDGNLEVNDACLPNCEFARCGDGILRTEYPDGCDAPNDDESCPRFEECDDGNDEDGDGCSGTCQIEE
jgi:cysteine-rich repeat protein